MVPQEEELKVEGDKKNLKCNPVGFMGWSWVGPHEDQVSNPKSSGLPLLVHLLTWGQP